MESHSRQFPSCQKKLLVFSLQAHHVDYMLKRRGNGRFHVVSTWSPRGVFVGLLLAQLKLICSMSCICHLIPSLKMSSICSYLLPSFSFVTPGDHLLSTYAIFFRKTNISNPLIRRRTSAYQGVRNMTFSENLVYVLHG